MANKIPYNFGTSAPKLDSAPARKSDQTPKRPFKVLPGGAPKSASAPAAAPARRPLWMRAAAVVCTMFAVVGFGRISLDSATSAMAMEATDLSSQIEVARSAAGSLEIEQSTLSNPTRIKEAAAGLGMVVPESTTFIDISGDVVRTDESGRLSLSGSIDALQ